MKLFFDTEFTGLRKDTTLISLGMVSEGNQTFYAEFTDYNKSQCNEWITENVLKNLVLNPTNINNKVIADLQIFGTIYQIERALREWLSQYDSVTLVSDVAHYDMVLFNDIFGGAFCLPQNVSPTCHDINQDIARFKSCSEKDAFDLNRENLAKQFGFSDDSMEKHNSLHDALIIKAIYEGINNERRSK